MIPAKKMDIQRQQNAFPCTDLARGRMHVNEASVKPGSIAATYRYRFCEVKLGGRDNRGCTG